MYIRHSEALPYAIRTDQIIVLLHGFLKPKLNQAIEKNKRLFFKSKRW